jgi:hypothetical protein
MNHEHQWIFLGELLLTYTSAELKHSDPDIRRLEYCGECSSARLDLGGGRWALIQGECTKKFLEQFESETSVVVKDPPPEFRFKTSPKKTKRLGRGLKDLMQEAGSSGTTIPGLFPAKPEGKN